MTKAVPPDPLQVPGVRVQGMPMSMCLPCSVVCPSPFPPGHSYSGLWDSALGGAPLKGAAAASRRSLDASLVLLGEGVKVGVVLVSLGSLLSQRALVHPAVWSPSLARPGGVGLNPQAAPEGEFGSFSLWEG